MARDHRTAERHLLSSGAQVPTVNPVHNQAAIFLRRPLPSKVTGIEGVNLAVGHKLVDVLVVRPRHEIPSATELIAVPVGAFADPAFLEPTRSVWDSRRHPWLELPEDVEDETE